DPQRSEGETDEGGDEQKLDRQSAAELADHVRAAVRRDRRQSGYCDLITGMAVAYDVELLVERVRGRQKLARVLVGHAPGHDDGALVGGDESPHQIVGQRVDIVFQRRDVRFAQL